MKNVKFKSNLHDWLRVFQGIITKHNEYVTIHFIHRMGGKLVLNANAFGTLVLIFVVQWHRAISRVFSSANYQYAYETTETKRLRSPMINIWNWVRSFDHSKEYCAIFTVKAEIYGDSFVLNKSLFRFIG